MHCKYVLSRYSGRGLVVYHTRISYRTPRRTRILIWYDRTRMVWLFVPYAYSYTIIYYCLQATYSYSYSQHSIAIYLRSWIISTVQFSAVVFLLVLTLINSSFPDGQFTLFWPAPKVALNYRMSVICS